MAPQEYIKKLEKLEKEVAELRYRVNMIQQVEQIPFPTWKPTWTIPNSCGKPTWMIPNSCAVCGLEFKGAMGYACTNPKCPTAITC
jgi:hypothetical protein